MLHISLDDNAFQVLGGLFDDGAKYMPPSVETLSQTQLQLRQTICSFKDTQNHNVMVIIDKYYNYGLPALTETMNSC